MLRAVLQPGAETANEVSCIWSSHVPVHAIDGGPKFFSAGIAVGPRRRQSDCEGSPVYYLCWGHLFTNESLPDYDANATALVTQRVLTFLDAIG